MPHVRANGIDIEYESFGRESDPLILLIMGFAAQLISLPEPLCQGLAARGFRVVRFDNRDIGKSTHLTGQPAPDPRALFAEVMAGRHPHVPYSLDDMANDTVGLMDALGADRAHIVGASMGESSKLRYGVDALKVRIRLNERVIWRFSGRQIHRPASNIPFGSCSRHRQKNEIQRPKKKGIGVDSRHFGR